VVLPSRIPTANATLEHALTIVADTLAQIAREQPHEWERLCRREPSVSGISARNLGREAPVRDGTRQLHLSALPQSARDLSPSLDLRARVQRAGDRSVASMLDVSSQHPSSKTGDNQLQLQLPFPITDDG
jgi:hypothetical protein